MRDFVATTKLVDQEKLQRLYKENEKGGEAGCGLTRIIVGCCLGSHVYSPLGRGEDMMGETEGKRVITICGSSNLFLRVARCAIRPLIDKQAIRPECRALYSAVGMVIGS